MRSAACLILLASTVATADTNATATDVLMAQLPQSSRGDDDAHERERYTNDAVLLGSFEGTVGETPKDYVKLVSTIGSIGVDRSRITALVAGGDQNVMWYTSDVATEFSGMAEGTGEIHGSSVDRITQLAVSNGKSWKVVASLAGFGSSPFGGPPPEISGATATGPLAPLLASPKALAAALSNDPHTFVIGTEKNERAIGPAAAKKLLTSWAKLSFSIYGNVREVETATYAFVQGRVKWTHKGKDNWMDAMLVAMPGPNGTWKIVGVHYSNLR